MTAQSRGWGPPPVPRSKVVTVRAPNGAEFPGGVHRSIAPLVAVLLEATADRGYHCVHGWCWGYAPRKVRGSSSTWSNHAWALAVDINAPKNPMSRTLITDMPGWMPAMWEDCGFRWGGRYRTRPDAMHFEYMGSPQDVPRDMHKARHYLRQYRAASADVTPVEPEEDELAKLSEEAQEFLERQYRDLVKHDAAPTSAGHLLRFYRGVRENTGIEEPEALGRYVGHASNQGARLADMLAETGSSIRGLVTGAVQLIREHRKT